MKRIISLVLVFFTLTACSGKKTVKPQLYGISFEAVISYYNESYKGECHFSPQDVLTFKITEPENISGYTVTLTKEGMTAEYLGLTYTPTDGNMPFSSVARSFYESLVAAAGSPEAAKETDGAFILSADSYTLYISESGLPQRMLIPDDSFTVYFYNVTALPAEDVTP